MYHGKAHVTRYRRATAKLIYIALVNQRIAYASKEVPRKMSDLEPCDEHTVIRLLRCVQQREKTGYRNAQVNSKRTRTVGCLQEHATIHFGKIHHVQIIPGRTLEASSRRDFKR